MIVRLVLIVLAFILGEMALIFLARRVYLSMFRAGIVSASPSIERALLLSAVIAPLVYAALTAGALYLLGRSSAEGLAFTGQGTSSTAPTPTAFQFPGQQEVAPPAQETPPDEQLPVDDPPQATSRPPDANQALENPPSGQIVYVCQVYETGLRDQICLINADGTGYRRLTTNDDSDYNSPAFSPGGDSIVYIAREGASGEYDIYEVGLGEGDLPLQLTYGGGQPSSPEISPDGSRIVFNRITGEINTIWIMDRDGSDQQQIFGSAQGAGWEPTWSPDGSRILFASDRGGSVQLYSMAPDGSDLQRLTDLPGVNGRSDYSPDGRQIATHVGGPWRHEIIVLDIESALARQITSGGNNLSPSYSPDGEWIVFTSYRDKYNDELGCEIYIMRANGAGITRLTFNDICDWQPRWSPE